MSAWRPNHGHKTPLNDSHCGEPFFIAAWGGKCVNRSSIKQRARGQKIDPVLGDIALAFVFIPFKHEIIWTLFVSIVKRDVGMQRGGGPLPRVAEHRPGVNVNHLRTACFSSRQGKPTGRRLHLAPCLFQGCGGGCRLALWGVRGRGDEGGGPARSGSCARCSRVKP